ncbi:MAG: methylmalonyl Co-A mutase-associated GTPase MeaB [Planctomycetes bacterium]|nr:methylmalonyl Co-A mutase-associated GTPase MeaB [Planctomycetota bacterium]
MKDQADTVVNGLVARFRAGEKAALARAISWAENGSPEFAGFLREVYATVGRAWRTGVTGPPGAGKSTLVNELAKVLRARARTVGILAVDPSSPITGGALLGDRIRMEERTSDPGVYIRSMASRGSHGGLSRAASDACDAIDAFGIDEILLETVGVGQAEYDVVSATDTVLVVLCPGAGDGIQAMKAGILEVADVLVVNKVDLPGSDRLLLDLEEAAHIRHAGRSAWIPPVVGCSAGKSQGIEDVVAALERHRQHLEAAGLDAVRAEKRVAQVQRVLQERLGAALWSEGGQGRRARTLLAAGRTPYDVVDELAAALVGALRGAG